jgi:hypothetical protein
VTGSGRASVTKFSGLDAVGSPSRYPYDDRWSIERTTGPDRIVVAPSRGHHVDVLLDLARCLREPFGVLYVLLLSRTGAHESGRYQSDVPASRAEAEAFVRRFGDYFEGDGRHHLWLMSLPDEATLVYDNHDLIYGYGPLNQYRAVLSGRGFSEGTTAIPAPHQHCYNAEYDGAENDLMDYWGWRRFPLQPDDDP